jgi:hypothetical protein
VGIVENRIIEGTQLKPVLNVKTLYGATHAGLSIEATITHIQYFDNKLVHNLNLSLC